MMSKRPIDGEEVLISEFNKKVKFDLYFEADQDKVKQELDQKKPKEPEDEVNRPINSGALILYKPIQMIPTSDPRREIFRLLQEPKGMFHLGKEVMKRGHEKHEIFNIKLNKDGGKIEFFDDEEKDDHSMKID